MSACSLQEVVGEPLSVEQRYALVDRASATKTRPTLTRARASQTAEMPSAGRGSTTTGPNDCSGEPRVCIKKSIDKQRVLSRRVSRGSGLKAKRHLDRDFDKRKAEAELIGGVERGVCAERGAQRGLLGEDALHVGPQDRHAEHGGQREVALNNLECKLAARIQEEAERRKSEVRATSDRIENVTARLEQFEIKDKGNEKDEEPVRINATGCEPRHVIVDGWPERPPKEHVEHEAKKWLEKLDCGEICRSPHAPRKHGEVVKARVKYPFFAKAHFCMAKAIARRKPGERPTYIVTNAEAGMTRRKILEATDGARPNISEGVELDDSGVC